MPTFFTLNRFLRDYEHLTDKQREAFKRARSAMVEDLRSGKFRKGLRIKRVQGTVDVFEMTWAPDGRATWRYGDEVIPGQPHIVWRRIGTHDIFREP